VSPLQQRSINHNTSWVSARRTELLQFNAGRILVERGFDISVTEIVAYKKKRLSRVFCESVCKTIAEIQLRWMAAAFAELRKGISG
jgi:hypothetical protein